MKDFLRVHFAFTERYHPELRPVSLFQISNASTQAFMSKLCNLSTFPAGSDYLLKYNAGGHNLETIIFSLLTRFVPGCHQIFKETIANSILA